MLLTRHDNNEIYLLLIQYQPLCNQFTSTNSQHMMIDFDI